MTSEITETFITKLDEFALSLEPAEQAMLSALLGDDGDDVTGFATTWPGIANLLPNQITLGPSGNGWIKDPGTDQVTMGPGGTGWIKDPGTD